MCAFPVKCAHFICIFKRPLPARVIFSLHKLKQTWTHETLTYQALCKYRNVNCIRLALGVLRHETTKYLNIWHVVLLIKADCEDSSTPAMCVCLALREHPRESVRLQCVN